MSWEEILAIVIFGFVIFGIFGNIACIRVLPQIQKNCRGVRLIRYLSYVDTLVLLYFVLFGIRRIFPSYEAFFNSTEFILMPISYIVYTFEIYLTVVIAVQRCMGMVLPYRLCHWMEDSVFNRILTGIVVFDLVYNIHGWIAWRPYLYWNESYNMTLIETRPRELVWFCTFENIITPVVTQAIPVILLLVCNTVLIISRRRMVRIPTGSESDENRANQLTAVVLAITLVSCSVHIFRVVSIVFCSPCPAEGTCPGLSLVWSLAVCVNTSVNFIFYCTFGKEFRHAVVAMFENMKKSVQHAASKKRVTRSSIENTAISSPPLSSDLYPHVSA